MRLPHLSLGGSGRWIVVAVGLVVIVTALVAAGEPYRQTREFRQVVACDRTVGNCFGSEPVVVTGRRTYTETTTHTNANGGTSTSTTTYYEVTWQRADGSRQTRDVSSSFYRVAEEGKPATVRLHRGQVVGVEVTGGAEWFLPESAGQLGFRLLLAFLGLGVALWGLLFGWWDGFFMLAWRSMTWMFLGIAPVYVTTNTLAYGRPTGIGLAMGIALCVIFISVAGWMLVGSLGDEGWSGPRRRRAAAWARARR